MFRLILVLFIACLINIPSVLSAGMLKKEKFYNITLANDKYELKSFSVAINNEYSDGKITAGGCITEYSVFYPMYFLTGTRTMNNFNNKFYRKMLDMSTYKSLYFVTLPDDYRYTYAVTDIGNRRIFMNMFANSILSKDRHTWQTVYQCTAPIMWYFLHEVFHLAYIYNKEALIELCREYNILVDWGGETQEHVASSFTEKNKDQFYAEMENQYRLQAAVVDMDYENDILEDQPYKPLR